MIFQNLSTMSWTCFSHWPWNTQRSCVRQEQKYKSAKRDHIGDTSSKWFLQFLVAKAHRSHWTHMTSDKGYKRLVKHPQTTEHHSHDHRNTPADRACPLEGKWIRRSPTLLSRWNSATFCSTTCRSLQLKKYIPAFTWKQPRQTLGEHSDTAITCNESPSRRWILVANRQMRIGNLTVVTDAGQFSPCLTERLTRAILALSPENNKSIKL